MRSISFDRAGRGTSIDSRKDDPMKIRIGLLMALALVAMIAAFEALKAHAMSNPTSTAVQRGTQPGQVTLNFASFGITQGQVARLNLASLRHPGALEPLQPDHAELIFLGENGRALAMRRVTIGAGESASFEVSMDDLRMPGNRLQLRATVRFTEPSPDACCGPETFTIPSVEILGRDSKTAVFIPYVTRTIELPTPDLGQ